MAPASVAPLVALLLAAPLLCSAPLGALATATATYTYPDAAVITELGVGNTFSMVYGMAVHSGSLYATHNTPYTNSPGEHKLWKIDTTSGAATEIASVASGASATSWYGIALNATGTGLNLATRTDDAVLEVSLTGSFASTPYISPSNFTYMLFPPYQSLYGLAVNGTDIFITYQSDSSVLKYASGSLSKLGGLSGSSNRIGGLAVGSGASAGKLYAVWEYYGVGEYNVDTAFWRNLTAESTFDVYDVAFDGARDVLYFSEAGGVSSDGAVYAITGMSATTPTSTPAARRPPHPSHER